LKKFLIAHPSLQEFHWQNVNSFGEPLSIPPHDLPNLQAITLSLREFLSLSKERERSFYSASIDDLWSRNPAPATLEAIRGLHTFSTDLSNDQALSSLLLSAQSLRHLTITFRHGSIFGWVRRLLSSSLSPS
jgi:hypothetical protein